MIKRFIAFTLTCIIVLSSCHKDTPQEDRSDIKVSHETLSQNLTKGISIYVVGNENILFPETRDINLLESPQSNTKEGWVGTDNFRVYYTNKLVHLDNSWVVEETFGNLKVARRGEYTDPILLDLYLSKYWSTSDTYKVKEIEVEGKPKTESEQYSIQSPLSLGEYEKAIDNMLRAFRYNKIIYSEKDSLETSGYIGIHSDEFSIYLKEVSEGVEVVIKAREGFYLKPLDTI